MSLHTTNSLSKLFEQTKQRQNKLKEERHKQKLKEQKNINANANAVINDEKQRKWEEILQLANKIKEIRDNRIKKQQINHNTTYNIYHTNQIIREQREDDLYTKEELMNIENLFPEEYGRINWNFYNELVNKTKMKIQTLQ